MTQKRANTDRATELVTIEEIQAAHKRIVGNLVPTPVIRSQFFSDLLDAEIYLKLESLQPTHSFKVRGALNAILSLPENQRRKGVITASGGNHGLGVAYASRVAGITATIYLPVKTPEIKVKAIKKLGAEVIMHGEAWDEANFEALSLAAEQGKAYIHPFDDQSVIAGQGTIVCELVDQVRQPDLIVASIGGGGLISGIISAANQLLPATEIAGVETAGADCMSRSVESGQIVELQAIGSIADSLGAKRTTERLFQIVRNHASQLATIDDASTVQASLDLLTQEKVLAEPAAACCLAALVERKLSFAPGATIVVVLCGGNIGLDKLLYWQQEFLIS